MEDFRRALLNANPRLSRFNPLSRILFYDDFDDGINGWSQLIGNYENNLDSILPDYQDLRPPQLSNLTMWDTGTAGSMEGTYALKLATRASQGNLAVAIKRQTFRQRGKLQFETYFTFKPEASEMRLGDLDVRTVGVLFDFQDGQNAQLRWMPHLRYVNAINGKRVGRWQYKAQTRAFSQIGSSGKTVSHFHLGPEGWIDVDMPPQELCYNEIATKMNWYYLRINIDLESRRLTSFQCNDTIYDDDALPVIEIPAMPNLYCMLNTVLFVEADSDKRAFLYVDSALLSAEIDE